jgi:hypothetical protein
LIFTKDNFYETLDSFDLLPEQITSVDEEAFKRVYGCAAANAHRSIVYVLRASRPIPRLKGESDVIYIGQTKGSFRRRYYQWAKLHATSKANRMKFTHIVERYGAIRVALSSFAPFGDSLLQAEGQLLWWYFQNHCEYPPVNYTRTKIRNDSVSFYNKDL